MDRIRLSATSSFRRWEYETRLAWIHQKLDQDGDVGLLNSNNDCWRVPPKLIDPTRVRPQHGVGLSTLSKWLRLKRDAVPAGKISRSAVAQPSRALVYEGVNAVTKIRDVLGPTDPSKAPPAPSAANLARPSWSMPRRPATRGKTPSAKRVSSTSAKIISARSLKSITRRFKATLIARPEPSFFEPIEPCAEQALDRSVFLTDCEHAGYWFLRLGRPEGGTRFLQADVRAGKFREVKGGSRIGRHG